MFEIGGGSISNITLSWFTENRLLIGAIVFVVGLPAVLWALFVATIFGYPSNSFLQNMEQVAIRNQSFEPIFGFSIILLILGAAIMVYSLIKW